MEKNEKNTKLIHIKANYKNGEEEKKNVRA